MAKKIKNPWMISTFVLAGIIIGTGIGLGVSQIAAVKNLLNKGGQNIQTQPADKYEELANGQRDIEITPVSSSDYIRGAKSPKVTFVEYSDPECPYCKKFHSVLKEIVEAFPNDVQWVYRNFPLKDLHPKAFHESVALECAGEIGGNDGFWQYLDRLMEVTPGNNKLDPKELDKIAAFVKLDKTKFSACLSSNKYDAKIDGQIQEAVQNGGDATPFSVVIAPDQKKYLLVGQVDFKPLSEAIKRLINPEAAAPVAPTK